MLQRQVHHRPQQQRAGQHQCPADHLPTAHLPRQAAAFGIAQPAHSNRRQHQQVTGLDVSGAHDHRVGHHQCAAQRRPCPERRGRSLVGQPRRIHHHAQGLQAVDQCAVGGRHALHGPGRQHRETENHPQRHQAQALDLLPGGPLFTAPQQQRRCRDRGHQGPAQAVEQRVHLLHHDAGHGQGQAEDDDAEQAEGQAGVFAGRHERA